jgi:FAD/FMN-containing dehydrogenase
VTDPLGLAAVAGSFGAVGMAGFTLGGGYGALIGRFGLALDNLLAADFVLADGRVVVATHGNEEELFWACAAAAILAPGSKPLYRLMRWRFLVEKLWAQRRTAHRGQAVLRSRQHLPLRYSATRQSGPWLARPRQVKCRTARKHVETQSCCGNADAKRKSPQT